jgi:hypothetical protein
MPGLGCGTRSEGVAHAPIDDPVAAHHKSVRADTLNHQNRAPLEHGTHGTTLAKGFNRMLIMLEVLLVVSSVGLSVVLSRLAVGEMFRLVRIDRLPAPVPSRDDAR